MNADDLALLALKGLISSLRAEEAAKVDRMAQQIREICSQDPDPGFVALALVGAENQVNLK